MIKGKNIVLIGILFLLGSVFVKATASEDQAGLSCSVLQNTFYQEELKTRSDLKVYIDKKASDLTSDFETKGQAFIDDNVKAFDDNMRDLVTKSLIKLLIVIVAGVLMAHLIWALIMNSIRKMRDHREQLLSRGGKR
jgi:hypothetical protein